MGIREVEPSEQTVPAVGGELRRVPRPTGGLAAQLKSERVQEMLKALPAWRPEGKSITRVRSFPTREAAGIFCGLVGSLAGAFALPAVLHVEDNNVKVTLHAKRARNRIGPVTEKVVQLAAVIG